MAKSEQVKADVKPELLTWARESAGLSVEAVAGKAHVSSDRIEEWESGDSQPTITQLYKLADIYKRPLGAFYLSKPPVEKGFPLDFRQLLRGGKAEELSFNLRIAIRKARLKREAALELSDALGEQIPAFELKGRVEDDADAVAARIRERLQLNGESRKGDARHKFNYWRGALERAGVLVLQAEKVDLSEMRGFSIAEHPLPVVVVNIKDAPAARNFSVFHETAHIVLGKGGLCDLSEDGKSVLSEKVESFCNKVAAATLMPRDELLDERGVPQKQVNDLDDFTIESLAKTFGVSREALLLRLVSLERIPIQLYYKKRDEYRSKPLAKKTDGGFAPPYTMSLATNGRYLSRLVFDAYAEEKIGPSDVVEYLDVRTKHFKKIEDMLSHTASVESEDQ